MALDRRANWSAAVVEATEEGLVLRVPIEGELSSDWEDAFARAVDAHRREVWGGQWGHVRHGPNEVRVEQVTEGSEKPLREFVDACLQGAQQRLRQEEADRREDEEALEQRRTEAGHEYEPTRGTHRTTAHRMTERFREG